MTEAEQEPTFENRSHFILNPPLFGGIKVTRRWDDITAILSVYRIAST